jgi:hypothetical protein
MLETSGEPGKLAYCVLDGLFRLFVAFIAHVEHVEYRWARDQDY